MVRFKAEVMRHLPILIYGDRTRLTESERQATTLSMLRQLDSSSGSSQLPCSGCPLEALPLPGPSTSASHSCLQLPSICVLPSPDRCTGNTGWLAGTL